MKTLNSLRSKLFALTLALMASVASFAYDEMPPDFKVDGLYYNFLEGDNVEVTHPYRPALPTESTSTTATQDSPDDYADLTELTIPSTVTYEGKVYDVTRIGYAAFDQCNFTYVDIPSSIKTIGVGAFSNCSSLTSIALKEGLEHIEGNAFADCRLLENITFPNSLKTVGSYAFSFTSWYNNQPNGGVYAGNVFYKYKGDIPENTSFIIKEGTVSISPDAFIKENRRIDYGLVAVAIPNSVEIIGEYAFSQCRALRSVNIPNGVTTIESYAFSYCKSLTSVTCETVEPLSLPSDVFFNASVANATLYVPAESVEAYKTAAQWKDFGQILPIEPTSYKSQWCDTWNVIRNNKNVSGYDDERTYRYQLTHDTIVDGETYTVLNRYWTAEPNTLNLDLGMVRFTDDRKVYANCNGKEYLVYDFSVQVGDTVEVLINAWNEGRTQKCLVHNVSTDVENRTVIMLYVYHEYAEEFIKNEYGEIKWIEGIGTENGFFEGSQKFVDGGTTPHLLCAYKDGNQVYATNKDFLLEYGCEYNRGYEPKDLFPTLAGLQRTTCLKNINENEVGTVWGSSSYLMQEIETTTIDGKQYLLFGTNNTYDEYWSLWLREENNKILVYSAAQKKDLVLYDFTLNVGDSLLRLYVDEELSSIVDYYKYEADWEYTKPLFVTEVSTITLLDGKEYKKWTFDNGMEYVEGIGSFGTSYAWNDFYQLIANGPLYSDVFSQHLVCASKNGKLLYQMDDAEMEQLETECLCDAENPKELFPTLWGLQQTICSGYYGEEGDEWASGLTGPSQEITMMDGKPYLQWGSWYLREENDKILVYSEIQKKDLVLYDFTLELGDTLTTLNLVTPEFLEYEGIVGIVDYPLSDYDYTYPIDTLVVTELSKETLLDGKEYTRWKFSDGTVYVEGIGSMSETFFHHIADHLPVPVSYLGSYLVCVSKNNKLLYQMDDAEMERLGAECLCDYNSGPKKDNAKNGKIGGRPTPTQWNMLEFETKEMDGTPTITRAETFSYTLENDSIVTKGKTFYHLGRQSTKDTAMTKSFVGALHFGEDEDNRVYFLRDGVEYVLYDFTAEPGDTIEIFAGINNYPQYTTYTHVVTGKDTLENGACRMMLEVVFPDETSSVENAQKVWLAGLGSIDGIVHNAATRATKARSSETQTSVMLCAWRDDDCLYTTDHPDYDSYGCVYNLPASIKDIETPGGKCQKLIRDGHLYIIHNGTMYNVIGLEVK